MKPKIFIGSSVEGLSVAYAIQQNLNHDAESTVWDQGVFDLSKTSIESLDETLVKMDYGVFVFSADDITIMRGNESPAVRDNVLFELGLFIGKLGRERVFFVIPDGSSIHIATDLLGVTPGKYNPNREDGSLQAATGPVCNQIREKIKKLGIIREIEESPVDSQSVSDNIKDEDEWSNYFLKNDYPKAREKLEKKIEGKESENKIVDECWLSYLRLKMNEKGALGDLCDIARNNRECLDVQKLIPYMLMWEDYNKKAIEMADEAVNKTKFKVELGIVLASCYKNDHDIEKSEEILNGINPEENSDVAIALADLHESDSDEALRLLSSAYENFPSNENIVYKFATTLNKHNKNKEALYLYDFLTSNYPEKVEYWGSFSNTCLKFKFYDKALVACQKAEELSESKEAWIIHNIGNIFNSNNLYSESISWLQKGLKLNPESQYAHDRLSSAIKSKEEQHEKYKDIRKEGRILLRDMNIKVTE
jgi:tetratricopeptide (TPR) repeat protein